MSKDPPVHPVAAVFPMLGKDDLQALANDIKVNGLIHPIVLDKDGKVLDGRNRGVACKLVGVEPQYVTVTPKDVLAYILSANVARRHLTKGALAMAVARAYAEQYPAAEYPKKRPPHTALASVLGMEADRLGEARKVLLWAPELVEQVLNGGSLEQAYQIAMERAAKHEEQERVLKRLWKKQPALWDRVQAKTLSLEAAVEIMTLLEKQYTVEKQIAVLSAEVTLSEEAVERALTLTDDQLRMLTQFQKPEAAPQGEQVKAGEVWAEIQGEIDTEALYRAEQILQGLNIRRNCMRIINGNKPEDVYAGLSIEDAKTATTSMEMVMRWAAQVYQMGLDITKNGKLEIVP